MGSNTLGPVVYVKLASSRALPSTFLPNRLALRRLIAAVVTAVVLPGCNHPTDVQPTDVNRTMRPQSIVLLVTPKMIPDFASPELAVTQFFEHYTPLISRAAEVILIFAVGNSDHILNYRGVNYWADTVEWARLTDKVPVSDRVLDYNQINGIVRAFKSRAASAGIKLKVYDQVDSGSEFTISNEFKFVYHAECTQNEWGSFDIRGRLRGDPRVFASAPSGITEGTLCGHFLVDQIAQYMKDFDFDGVLYKNQLGTRGRWTPGEGPGYSIEEAAGIQAFLDYSRRSFGIKDLMWFDSYNNIQIERETFSFPAEGYRFFNYLIASGFCVITDSERYLDNLKSKLTLGYPPRIIATLDYVDPWYSYRSMTEFRAESARLEEIAIEYRHDIDGLMLFASDAIGALVPRYVIESFAARFFGSQ